MSTLSLEWTEREEQVAQTAFNLAYHREMNTTLEQVRAFAQTIELADDLWKLHDFLSSKRHEMDGKYDSRSPMLIFVFAQLIKAGWITLDELEGLAPDKLSKISALTRL